MSRLAILKNSLVKKEAGFNQKLDEHFQTVKQANGQPLNDKRNGHKTLAKWDRQNNSLRAAQAEIEKTKNAIDREESKISYVNHVNETTPKQILDLVEQGVLNQWRKHPNTFFVNGVDKARIVWLEDKKCLAHRYLSEIKDKEQYAIFRDTYNKLNSYFKP